MPIVGPIAEKMRSFFKTFIFAVPDAALELRTEQGFVGSDEACHKFSVK